MPVIDKEKDQDKSFYSPDGSHDDLGGLSPAEDAEFNSLASNFKDEGGHSPDKPKAGSDNAGAGLYAPSSPIGFAKQLILQAGLKRLGIGGGLLGLILTIVAVISVIAPSFFAVHVKEVYTDHFGRESQLTTRRRFRKVKKHFIIKQDDVFDAYKQKGRLMRQVYGWDMARFREDMRSRGVILDVEGSKAVGYRLVDADGSIKQHVKRAEFPPGRKGIAAFRKQAIADFGFDGLNRTSQQSISEIIDDQFYLDSWGLRSGTARGAFARLRLFRGNPFQNSRATQYIEAREAELGRDLTLNEEVEVVGEGTVNGELDGDAPTLRISPDDAEFDTATDEGKASADQQSRLNELPDEVTSKAEEARAANRDPANPFEHKADKAVGEVTSKTLEKAGEESLSFGSLVGKASDPTIQAADYACRIKMLLTGAIISGMLIRTGVLMELTNLVFNVGDSQKAGIISPHVLGAFMALITSVDSQGRSFNDSPGYNKAIGNPSAKSMSPQGLALFGTNRTLPSPFGSVLGFLNNTPGINSQRVCGVVTNTLFNLGASAALVTLTVVTGPAGAIKSIGWGVFLKTIIKGVGVGLTIEGLFQLTVFFAMPIMVEAAAGAVFTFDEGGFLSAEAITIGSSLLFMSMARSNLGARAVTNGQLAAIHQEIEADRAVELAQMSWYDRWLSPDNHQSLTAKVLVGSPMSASDGLARAKFAMINLFNPFQSGVAQGLAKQASALTPAAYAEDDLARDITGNLIMATPLDELDKIDPMENIKFMLDKGFIKDIASTGDVAADSEAEMETVTDNLVDPYKGGITYADYVELCFTSSVEVDPSSPDASPDDIVGYGNEKCSSPGPIAAGDVPLDEDGEVDIDNGVISKPGLYERFRAYRTDSFLIDSFSESVSRDFGGSAVSTATAVSSSTAGAQIEGDPYTDSESVACAAGTEDIGPAEGYSDGKKITLRLCSLPNLPSSGQADSPGGPFSTPGASGFAVVNSRVSGAWFALVNDMKTAGLNPTAFSSYRSMAHQKNNCTVRSGCADGDYTLVAQPGYSSHQAGVAIDFEMPRQKGGTTCATRAKLPNNAIWAWLNENSEKYGFKQYAYEAWHWDAYPAADRCGKV